jgi:hypothetical protein
MLGYLGTPYQVVLYGLAHTFCVPNMHGIHEL